MARLVVNGPLTIDSLHNVVGSNSHIVIGGFATVDPNAFKINAGSAVEQRAELGLQGSILRAWSQIAVNGPYFVFF